jgi:hypothetical protein
MFFLVSADRRVLSRGKAAASIDPRTPAALASWQGKTEIFLRSTQESPGANVLLFGFPNCPIV